MLAKNTSAPLPIASITKLLTAMTVLDGMNPDQVVDTPNDIRQVQRHRVGIRPGDKFTVRDLLHGMLIESGNDCAEALARAYPKGGRHGFMRAMNEKAHAVGARSTRVYTPSGLDLNLEIGRSLGKPVIVKKYNVASAEDVALIARTAFMNPLIREISGMKTYTMVTKNETPREYPLHSNDKLLDKSLPVTGAKTGYTDLAGRCIVAMFNDVKKAKDYLVVVLNSPSHFKTAEKVYQWVCKP
jgi:D-alanyl-D-alanine carboxypeptidase